MRARHIMSSPVTTVTGSESVIDCLRTMETTGFTVLPVVDDSQHLTGIVSEGDLLREQFRWSHSKAADDDEAGKAPTAADAMSSPVVAMTAEADISDLASAMLKSRLRGIPIVHDKDIIGIVTRRDLIGVLTMDDTHIAHEIQHRLDVYSGTRRWEVHVAGGSVTIDGTERDDPECGVIAALAETVPGVNDVSFP